MSGTTDVQINETFSVLMELIIAVEKDMWKQKKGIDSFQSIKIQRGNFYPRIRGMGSRKA